jgi:ATP-dependent DNA helicase RecG
MIILGLDEATGFRPVQLTDPQALKQGLALKARSFTPPVQLTISDGVVDGAPVVVARVHECDASAKPCRVTASGAAYVRGYDGDFELSALEEQAFLAARQRSGQQVPLQGSGEEPTARPDQPQPLDHPSTALEEKTPEP